METIKTETLSFRVPSELKTEFLKIFKQSDAPSKPELFKELLKNYNREATEISHPGLTSDTPLPSSQEKETNKDIPDGTLDNTKTEIEEEEDPDFSEREISIKLNPVQVFTIRETILNNGFVETINKLVDKVDNAKDTSLFGNSLFSGSFKGVFTPMDLDESDEESINKNMGIELVNQFMSAIVIGPGDMLTPVTSKLIKRFIKEAANKEAQEEKNKAEITD